MFQNQPVETRGRWREVEEEEMRKRRRLENKYTIYITAVKTKSYKVYTGRRDTKNIII